MKLFTLNATTTGKPLIMSTLVDSSKLDTTNVYHEAGTGAGVRKRPCVRVHAWEKCKATHTINLLRTQQQYRR
ncbi:hypothetical protein GOP47_0013387 [Adiantum capillus-veneris]|uniref:Uncharacterized protein n=1 Tax=Adiantum capillus-veneris TaxID=13818 RepID=A0A9D4UNL7_ADICA|nr:hypothetical protein GOP47_0013387 [Adiantum capillus-veneris]